MATVSTVGTEILVNTAIAGSQSSQKITALANGGFVVTWTDGSFGVGGAIGDTSGAAVKAQVFAADGTPVGSELLVNTATANNQNSPRIAALANGGFVVTWDDATGDSNQSAVKAQVFLADGTRVGSELLVNTAVQSFQANPEITALANGRFVVTWEDFSAGAGGAPGDNDSIAVKAQVFAADGTGVGTELLVNSATANGQDSQQITALANGGFVVTWEDFSAGAGGATGDGTGAAVKAQVFQSDGTPVGPELLVNTATANRQDSPQITALTNGGFVVTWRDNSLGDGGATGDSSSTAVKAQVFAADGTRIGSELLVNTATVDEQEVPRITALANGAFVVTWLDQSQGAGGATGDSDQEAVKAQVFLADGTRAGSELLVNTATVGEQGVSQVTALSNGGFVVTWEDFSQGVGGATGDGSNYAVKAQVFAVTVSPTPAAPSPGNDGDGNFLFDTPFYLSHNPDVDQAGVNALNHFNTIGFHEGRDPNSFFDTSGYLAVNKDVAASGVNPIDHFHHIGWKQGRDPSADFDTTLYIINNPDVAAAGIDPLEHFLRVGFFEGRQAFAAVGQNIANGFDAQFYLFHNPDVAAAGVDPLFHYNVVGFQEGRDPNAYFDSAGYLSHYADVAAAGINPLQHYEQVGWTEGRDPSAGFDTLGYLAANPDVAAAGVNPLDHFLTFGIYEGRTAINDGLFH